MHAFKDHFSTASESYTAYRPRYPGALFDYLAAAVARRRLALDCATGGGQAAGPLASRFRRVVATDASLAQLGARIAHDRVAYVAARAEATPLAEGAVDLVAVSQALHWFEFEAFFAECARVLAPGGLLAAWTYDLVRIDSEVDARVDRIYREVDASWPPERAYVDSRYESISFPAERFERLEPPELRMSAEWDRDRLVGYVGTWSAVARHRAAHSADPVPGFARTLAQVWPDRGEKRRATWRLTLLVGRLRDNADSGGAS